MGEGLLGWGRWEEWVESERMRKGGCWRWGRSEVEVELEYCERLQIVGTA
jgi:hypothetical protein